MFVVKNNFATFLGISRQMYIKYEQGVIAPPVKVVKEWAISHGIPVKEYPPDVKHYLHNACHKRNESMAIGNRFY